MKLLEERILKDGIPLGTDIVKVDSFLNHQIDIELLNEIGKEFKKRFATSTITKILTVEASGIAIACIAAQYFGVPVVFAKKAAPNTMVDGMYQANVKSFTKNTETSIKISKKYIHSGDKILIIDDFLAYGQALSALIEICHQAEAEVVGAGIVIEKGFQSGGEELRKQGYRIESLCVIESIEDEKIKFI